MCANVVTGMFKVCASAADGRDQIVGLLHAGDFIGNPSPSTNRFTITALTDPTICVIPRQLLENFMSAHAKMERLLLDRTHASLEDARLRILLLANRSAEARIATFLLDLTSRSIDGDCTTIRRERQIFNLGLSRGQLAEILGLSSETVSRGLSCLKDNGLIALPGGRTIAILDKSALTVLAGAS
ncbi:Crp/Fnr family transcriptional regulator [Novosphingobium sp. G106]|uniref:Crp/Fnr family transcriptional regulator n=1 Tax=Novosphingobium sp. G106 TaxID=2849500 RepID=UPI0028110F9B|nr:Crp/Fnr family transcriptional regulator [Novosphingobium sp. G106]